MIVPPAALKVKELRGTSIVPTCPEKVIIPVPAVIDNACAPVTTLEKVTFCATVETLNEVVPVKAKELVNKISSAAVKAPDHWTAPPPD